MKPHCNLFKDCKSLIREESSLPLLPPLSLSSSFTATTAPGVSIAVWDHFQDQYILTRQVPGMPQAYCRVTASMPDNLPLGSLPCLAGPRNPAPAHGDPIVHLWSYSH